jgi:hypothetical protein
VVETCPEKALFDIATLDTVSTLEEPGKMDSAAVLECTRPDETAVLKDVGRMIEDPSVDRLLESLAVVSDTKLPTGICRVSDVWLLEPPLLGYEALRAEVVGDTNGAEEAVDISVETMLEIMLS